MSPHQLTNAERTRCTTQHANDKPAIHLPSTSKTKPVTNQTRVDPHQQQIDDRKHYTIEPADPTYKIMGTTQITSLQVNALTPGAAHRLTTQPGLLLPLNLTFNVLIKNNPIQRPSIVKIRRKKYIRVNACGNIRYCPCSLVLTISNLFKDERNAPRHTYYRSVTALP